MFGLKEVSYGHLLAGRGPFLVFAERPGLRDRFDSLFLLVGEGVGMVPNLLPLSHAYYAYCRELQEFGTATVSSL